MVVPVMLLVRSYKLLFLSTLKMLQPTKLDDEV